MTETEKKTALSQLLMEVYSMVNISRAEAEGTLDACADIEAAADELAKVLLVEKPQSTAVYDGIRGVAHG